MKSFQKNNKPSREERRKARKKKRSLSPPFRCKGYAPLPHGFTEIDEVIRDSERDVIRAAALARARRRLAKQLEADFSYAVADAMLKAREE